MVKIKKSFFDKIDDSSVKYAFGLSYIVGALVIFFGPNLPGKYTSTIILIALMMAYLLGVIFLNKKIQGKGIGFKALKLLIDKNPRKRYLANVNPKNKKSSYFFKNNGFNLIQHTYELEKIS